METSGPFVAIVDDDDAVRRALVRLLSSLSFSSAPFSSGEDFLASLGDAVPGCALLDLHMPGLKGLDVLFQLRREGRLVPIIVITGFDQSGMRERCFEAGASAYLIKPLERSEVANAIQLATAT